MNAFDRQQVVIATFLENSLVVVYSNTYAALSKMYR